MQKIMRSLDIFAEGDHLENDHENLKFKSTRVIARNRSKMYMLYVWKISYNFARFISGSISNIITWKAYKLIIVKVKQAKVIPAS